MENNREETGKEQAIRDEKGRFLKGVSGNPKGRPLGVRDFATDFEEAIRGIKDAKTGEQITMQDIIRLGLQRMIKGSAKFDVLYRDLLDRHYGKAKQTVDLHGSLSVNIDPEERAMIEKAIDDL